MKREILCPDCNSLYLSLAGVPMGDSEQDNERRKEILSNPREYSRRAYGTLSRSCHCDGCGIHMPALTQAIARSSWTDETPIKYYEWESEYLTVTSRS